MNNFLYKYRYQPLYGKMLSEKLVDRLVEGIPDYETLKTTIKQTHERSKGPILAVCITYFIIFYSFRC